MSYTLREATAADVEALRALAPHFRRGLRQHPRPVDHQQYIATAYTAEQLRHEIEDSATHTVLAFPDDKPADPCGFVMLIDRSVRPGDDAGRPDDYLQLKRIYVDSGHYGRGLAGLFVRRAIAVATEKNRTAVWLGVNQKNLRACKFYEKQGFEATGTRTFHVGAAVKLESPTTN